MAGFINSSDASVGTGNLYNHFLTFSRPIIIHKQPIEIISSNVGVVYPGYSDASVENSTSFTPVSGIYSAIVNFSKDQKEKLFPELRLENPKGTVMIKMMQSGRDYLLNGKTQAVEIDSLLFRMISTPKTQSFLNLNFYYFALENMR